MEEQTCIFASSIDESLHHFNAIRALPLEPEPFSQHIYLIYYPNPASPTVESLDKML